MKKKTLVIGASTNTARYSNMAIKKLVDKQQPVVALGLRKGEVEGVKIENEQIVFPDILITLNLQLQKMSEKDHILNFHVFVHDA